MKIAIIVNPLIAVPPEKYGGIERIVFMLIQQLISHGDDITLYANSYSVPGCKLIGYTESVPYGTKDFLKINLLTAKIAFSGYDLVHTFGRMSNIAALMLLKIPKIVSYQLPPTLSQVKKAVRLAPAGSLYFTACSDFIAGQINNHCDVTTIHNGVDVADYSFNESVPANAPLVFLGRIQEEKGTAIAIQVAKKTGRRLVIAGNIPNEDRHQKYFERLVKPHINGNQITYVGAVDDQQKNQLLRNAAALLMPVTWDEPFGIVMAEALACGTPVIGLKRGAVPEVVTNGINGYVCGSFEELVTSVHKLNEIKRSACRKITEDRFSAIRLALKYRSLYQRALNKA